MKKKGDKATKIIIYMYGRKIMKAIETAILNPPDKLGQSPEKDNL